MLKLLPTPPTPFAVAGAGAAVLIKEGLRTEPSALLTWPVPVRAGSPRFQLLSKGEDEVPPVVAFETEPKRCCARD